MRFAAFMHVLFLFFNESVLTENTIIVSDKVTEKH